MTGGSLVGEGSTDSPATDYESVELPSEPREEYSYVERRAELLQLIREAGHPSELHQGQLAERYGVSQQQISKDIDRLGEYIHEQLSDRDRRALIVNTAVTRAIRGLLKEEEWRKAARTAIEYDEWATQFHDLDELAEEVERLKAESDGVAGGVGVTTR